jgi:hypothetical protein
LSSPENAGTVVKTAHAPANCFAARACLTARYHVSHLNNPGFLLLISNDGRVENFSEAAGMHCFQ